MKRSAFSEREQVRMEVSGIMRERERTPAEMTLKSTPDPWVAVVMIPPID